MPEDDDFLGSRRACVELPIFDYLYSYVCKTYKLPNMGYEESGTAYHYTDAAGALGIIKSGRFWASDTDFLNDTTERKHVSALAAGLLTTLPSMTPLQQKFVQIVTPKLTTVDQDNSLFAISFCRDGDLLSQWRGYGSFGSGYALGFSIPELRPHPQVGRLLVIDYEVEKQVAEVIKDLLSIMTEYFDRLNPFFEHRMRDLADDFVQVINLIGHGCKHPAYKEEQELRMVLRRSRLKQSLDKEAKFQETAIAFRPRGSNIVPFIETSLDFPSIEEPPGLLPLTEIVVGPGVDFAANCKSLRLLLDSKGYDAVAIRQSSVPFRA